MCILAEATNYNDLIICKNRNECSAKTEAIMKEHIPNKLTSTRTNLPWFNRGLKRMC